LAENAQEFIFVHIPKTNMGDNPLRTKKIGRTTFFLGATPMIIGSIFYRSKPRGITSDEYNSKVDQLNRFLHHYFQDSEKVNFWQIRGLMRPKKNILVDGVHLNEDALIKYAAQVRMAVKCDDFRV
jgi:hypothetical protein